MTLPPPTWLPAALLPGDQPMVEWRDFGTAPLAEPFFEESLARLGEGERTLTPLNAVIDAPQPDSLAPTGLVFHMSRCGSTLVSQMLAASDKNVMVSEADPLDAVVQLRTLDPDRHAAALRAMAAALGRNRTEASRYFLKLDSWHALALPLFRRAFPDVPWIFLYRDPVEVLVSHARRPGRQVLPGGIPPEVLGVDPVLPPLDYAAQVLARICEAALSHAGPEALFLDYADLPDALFDRILPHFRVKPARPEKTEMAMAAMRNAKQPRSLFLGDADAKQAAAGPEIRAAAERWLAPLHARMVSLSSSPR